MANATNQARFTLFVYGTLLPGEPAHALLEGALAMGPARTPPTFNLFDLGPYPALVAGGSTAVVGELFEVTRAMLLAIDVHEEVPVLFGRSRIRLDDGREVETYLLDPARVRGRRRIRSGDWRARFRVVAPATGAREAAIVRWAKNRPR